MDFIESIGYNIVALSAIMMPVLLVLIVLLFAHKKAQERNRIVEKMMEKGADPDTVLALLDGKKTNEKSPAKHFQSGVTLVSVGLGLMAMNWLCGWNTAGIGAFLAILGLGEMAVAWYLRRYSK